MTWRRSTKIQAGVLAANVLFWGAILGWTVTVDEDDIDPPDHLDDPAFALAAEPICAAAVAELEQRDLLHPSPDSPADRADIVDSSNAVLAAMVDDLADSAESLAILLGLGTGLFNTPLALSLGGDPKMKPGAIAIGDANGDGAPDLAVVGTGSADVSIALTLAG